MDVIRIKGGKPLIGEISISGSKNAVLPLLVASLLTNDTVILSNVPYLADIVTMVNLLMDLGVNVTLDGNKDYSGYCGKSVLLNAGNINNLTASYDIVKKMRASILVMGPLLVRYGYAKISMPGGCAIGSRPIDIHLDAFKQMGASITMTDGYVVAEAKNGLHGAEIFFSKPSVGATEHIIMTAVLANGKTVINNAAREPEILDLCNFLREMGADISGDGTSIVEINGVKKLHGANYHAMYDRIEAGTYAIAAAITNGEVLLKNIDLSLLSNINSKLSKIGISLKQTDFGVFVKRSASNLEAVDIYTDAYPGFATDMQAQFMALLSVSKGVSTITENIFENRFMHVPELNRMGANITLSGNNAIVRGVDNLHGAHVMATDLRASVSLILAALVAKEESHINRVYHLDRGYEYLENKLSACGIDIDRMK